MRDGLCHYKQAAFCTRVTVTYLPVIVIASPTPQPSPFPTLTATPQLTATPLPPSATPTATPLGGWSGQIAFASIKEGKRSQIWLAYPDGTNLRALTDIMNGAFQTAWTPDGAHLVFVSPCLRPQDEYPGASLTLINADGSNPIPLPSLPGGDFDPAYDFDPVWKP